MIATKVFIKSNSLDKIEEMLKWCELQFGPEHTLWHHEFADDSDYNVNSIFVFKTEQHATFFILKYGT